MSSMAEWPAGHNLHHFRALHLVSQPHPGSRHGEPKRLVAVGPRSARHLKTLLNEMFVNCNLHCTAPSCCTCRRYEPWSAAEVRSRNGGKRAVDRESTLRSGTKGLRMLVGKTDHRPQCGSASATMADEQREVVCLITGSNHLSELSH